MKKLDDADKREVGRWSTTGYNEAWVQSIARAVTLRRPRRMQSWTSCAAWFSALNSAATAQP